MANILLGVSGGIAAYKTADLASTLTQRGDHVRTLMTANATKFIGALTYRAVTGEPVYTSIYDGDDPERAMEHISLSDWGDILLIAPATADIIARLAMGLADDIVTTTACAFPKKVVVAPAMNDHMWANPIVQDNLTRLREVAGYTVIAPESGHLACGNVGPGRLPATESLIASIDAALAAQS